MMSASSDNQLPEQRSELSIECDSADSPAAAARAPDHDVSDNQISITTDTTNQSQTAGVDAPIEYNGGNENTNETEGGNATELAASSSTDATDTVQSSVAASIDDASIAEQCTNGAHECGDASHSDTQSHTVLESSDNFFMTYFGELVLDQRHTHPMLPWVMAEVRRQQQAQFILLQVLPQTIQAVRCDSSQLMFEHKLQSLSRFVRSHQVANCFAYLTTARAGSVCTCHVFEASDEPMVQQLFSAIRDATKGTVKDPTCLHDLIPPGGSLLDAMGLSMQMMMTHLYEVLYVGRVLVSSKKTPPTFIDEVIEKFEERKKEEEFERRRNVSGASVRSLPADLEVTVRVCENELSEWKPYLHNGSVDSSVGTDGSGGDAAMLGDATLNVPNELSHGITTGDSCENLEPTYDPENRIRLIQVGDTELCLISPDRKSVILQQKFKDISFCSQGIKYRDHFGFISREPKSNNFLCYIFKCSDESVVEEIMKTLKQAFQQAFQHNSRHRVMCPLCPMRQLHQLCVLVNRLPSDQVNELLLRRICHLKEKDRSDIIQRLETENPAGVTEMNEVLMGILRVMCEEKQMEHIHMNDHITSSNGSKTHCKNEFYLMDCGKGKSSKFDALRNRAKKTLANSFESLIRGRKKKEEMRYQQGRRWTLTTQNGIAVIEDKNEEDTTRDSTRTRRWTITSPTNTPVEDPHISSNISEACDDVASRPSEETSPEETYEMTRPRSFTAPCGGSEQPPPLVSPSRNKPKKSTGPLFLIESYLRSNVMAGGKSVTGAAVEPTPPPQGESAPRVEPVQMKKRTGHRPKSWRLEILNRVVTPGGMGKSLIDRESGGYLMSPVPEVDVTPVKLSQQELRDLWKKAVLEVLLLIKMERENKKLRVRQTEAEMKRQKLDYEEMTPCLKQVTRVWDEMLCTPEGVKINTDVIQDAVREGVPRNRRGDIWWQLMEQHKLHRKKGHQPAEELTVQYKDLLKELTSYQHAILIDLGRTFPSHPYFAQQLGAGQLSLFNLLKAYSLLDQQVGYCQGLSFVAGVLLMHMPEEQSFEALRYILFELGFRQQYQSDMVSMQIQLYQLSRLLHDHHPDLYCHLEEHEIAPVHYSAAWFLTMFASEFPLAFVSRVFDLIFLQGIEVIFKVALVLLGNHKESIKQCDSIESIMTFLKVTLPNLGVVRMEQVFAQVFDLDISSALQAYEVEYHVLQEEITSSPRQYSASDAEQQLLTANESLRSQNARLAELLLRSESRASELEQALWSSRSHAHDLEQQLRVLRESHNKMASRVHTFERQRAALVRPVLELREGVIGAMTDLSSCDRETQDMTSGVTKKMTFEVAQNMTCDVAQNITSDKVIQNRTFGVTRNMTSDKVTQNTTPDKVTQNMTSDKVTQNVTCDKVTPNMTSDKVTQNMTSDKVTQNMTSDKVTQNMTSDKVTQNMTSDKVTQNVTCDKVTPNMTSDKVTQNMTSDKVTQNMTSDKVTQNMTSDKVTQNMTSDKVTQNMTSDKVTQNMTSDKVIQNMTSDKVTQNMTFDKVTQDMTSDKLTQHMTCDKVTQNMTCDKVTQNMTSDKVTQNVTSDKVTQNMTPDKVTQNI